MTKRVRIYLTLLWLPVLGYFNYLSHRDANYAYLIRTADAQFQSQAEQIIALNNAALSKGNEIIGLLYIVLVAMVFIWCKLISLERDQSQ